ncbi:MAG: efflux RND transporter periplasmic adaptor subunit [Anaerolineae bacterium]|nr:efflux RND transporter periplasmic adaptor subunit [Anaerolineae bacterium]MBL8106715.1 efflux RND transporter periplasmic adaptor subunit [Anaerolineales bacterium]MCC7187110.1 efflux RND transporter periplasmic adaptor subunit [Anaerolineales bacterium]HQU35218.1 efflux RND transporter periplasmic adaptor subunit [Anaerolineales bacterium]
MRDFFKKRKWLWIVLLILILGVGGSFYLRNSQPDTASQFQTASIERGNLVATIGATGTVRAKQSATLIWQAAGTVDVVNAKVGDNVPADFVLAYLEKTSLPQSIILAEADLASAQQALDDLTNSDTALAQATINLRDAQAVYDKAANWRKELNGKIHIKEIIYKTFGNRKIPVLKEYRGYAGAEAIAKADEDLALAKAKLDDAQREFDRLAGGNLTEIAAAQARVDAAQATLNLARVSAPFAATITEANPLPGDQVSAGATAFRLDDLTSLLVDVEVSEVDINSVAVGQPATLSFDAILDKDYHGEVVEVAKAGTNVNGVVNFKVTIELTDADAEVKPGMTAAVNITVEQIDDVILIPNRAVRLLDGQRYIYLMVNGIPQKTEVSLGASSDTMSVLVGGDVSEGASIILNPPVEVGGPFGG